MNARHVAVVAVLTVALTACDREEPGARILPGADVARGGQALTRYGCGACHQIPGVPGARGIVGPSLAGLANRPYLAGRLINDPLNLVAWIQRPRIHDPQTIMPDLAVSESDARDIAAFLFRSGS